MKSNLALIGMPGAGKSTIGSLLARQLDMGFIDTDLLIEKSQGQALQRIVDEKGHLALRAIEEAEIMKLAGEGQVIATGGSAAYSDRAMRHLRTMATLIFLRLPFETVRARIDNFASRGIARAAHQSLRDLFDERQPLYEKYAELTIDCQGLSREEITARIVAALQNGPQRPKSAPGH